MSLIDDFNKMHLELKGQKRTDELKEAMKKKYNKLYLLSDKLFDKIYEKDCNSSEVAIIKKMITMKIQKDNGVIDKFNADKEIGELLCNTYVKPMLSKQKKDKNK